MNYWGSGMVRLCLPRGELVERRREGARAAYCGDLSHYALGCLLLLGVVTVRRGVKVCCLCGGTEPEAAVTGGYWATG